MKIKSVIIAGSREFNHYETLRKSCDYYLQNEIAIEIVSGTAPGADQLGERYAIEKGYPIKPFPADWENTDGKPEHEIGRRRDGRLYWKLAGHVRNEEMAKYADALIAFWDGKSTGTKNMIEQAKKHNLEIRIFNYANT
jgi:hypothetical protein